MAFSISSRNLPRIRTYQQAVDFWKEAPVQDGLFRTLNTKRDTSKRVWSPDDGKTIRFRFHHTDLVEYTEEWINITFWNSVSSGIFIDCLSPLRTANSISDMRVNGVKPELSSVRFRFEKNEWVPFPEDMQQEYKVVVDRKIAAAVRKRLAPFENYRRARAALEGRKPRYTQSAYIPPWLELERFEDPAFWPQTYLTAERCAPTALARRLIVNAGGVRREPLPLGVAPSKSVYDLYI